MPAAKTADRGITPDRSIVIGAISIVVMVTMMVAALIAGHLNYWGPVADRVAFWLEVIAAAGVILIVALAAPLALREMRERRQVAARALTSGKQVEQLFKMADMLQSALDHADANAVLRATAAQLLPDFGGALYVFNNSRDRLDLSTAWDWRDTAPPPEMVLPSQCWALKRGKPHLNLPGIAALRCEHHHAQAVVLEIPMMARGEVYGLLQFQGEGDDAETQLASLATLAGAVADAMSLALSNIALREKLRTQALRDPLTGLYNRRYMEDVLERYANLAERNGHPLSVVMIDLDHFKRLNDEHGHALGDAVLREVAAAIAGSIRPSDVACRYGGEELIVLLPDCGLDEALLKAEMLRTRIERLSDLHSTSITASFGVAAMPDTSTKGSELVANADGALYVAKQTGRNRVHAADRRMDAGRHLRAAE